jgi:CopG family nickel-responsive transcriptional regulator
MSDLARVTISLEENLLNAFDKLIETRGYANRSEAIRDLIRDRLIKEEGEQTNAEQVAVVTIVYDHHSRELSSKLIDKAHSHHDIVVSAMHVHLGEHHCLEVSILRGKGKLVRSLAHDIVATRGVLHGDISFTSDEKAFHAWSADHEHSHGDGHSHSHGS